MAGPAVGKGIDVPDDPVLDLHVALVAFDLVLGDVGGVHQVRVLDLVKPLLFPVALVAVLVGNAAVADDCVAVAFVAGEAVVENRDVVESGSVLAHQGLFLVAVVAVVDPGIVFALLEVADETGAFGDRDMLPLDDLGVTARALELLSPFRVGQVDLMVENHLVELNLSFEQPLFVAARAKAAFVADLGPRLGLDV